MRGGEGGSHSFKAGDLKEEGLPFRCVGIATDGANGFLEERFSRRIGHFAFKGAKTGAFG